MTPSLHQIPLDAEILSRTPPEVIELILSLLERIRVLEARVEELEAKLNKNSSNSNKPPSSDPSFVKRPEAAESTSLIILVFMEQIPFTIFLPLLTCQT